MSEFRISESGDGVVFTVKVVPGSSRTVAAGLLDGMLKVKVAAPPEKGKANQCLTEFLAEVIGVKKKAVSVVSGQTGAVKQILVSGVKIRRVIEVLDITLV